VEEIEQQAPAPGAQGVRRAEPVSLCDVGREGDEQRISTGVDEFDRVLGGGLVEGSLVLLGGEPGIGKSTLLLQAAEAVAGGGTNVLYVCGEESPRQIALRARRIGAVSENLALLPEVDVSAVEDIVRRDMPGLLVIDSIQTAVDPDLGGAAGSVGQIRACTARLMRIAKDENIATIIVGHVTKDGAIAGPRVLEHMVDTVLYFEGDRDHAFRVVRAVKNRFGSTSEVGIFEMEDAGLVGVGQPSAALLSQRVDGVPGSTVMAAVEGSRPLLVEIQALVTPSYLPAPRRLATGIETGRLLQVLAVLERRAGLSFAGQDVYVTVAGGIKISEPAADLALAIALASALTNVAVPSDVAVFGELALTGSVRRVPHAAARVREAGRMGMGRVVGAHEAAQREDSPAVCGVETLAEALEVLRLSAR
jgi:DNA repair protein RadA/Sms